MITLELQSNTITPVLERLALQAERPRAIYAAAGRGVTNLFRKHLHALDRSRPNRLGGRRTHFWSEMARTCNLAALSESGATISISHPSAAQKHRGGTITAKRARFLTIPVAPEAHGRTARTLEAELGIKLFVRSGALVGREEGELKLTTYYALKHSVTQGPDPEEGILPPEAEILAAAESPAMSALQRQLKPGAAK